VPWGHEFDFYLAIERIPIGLADTGIYRPITGRFFGSKRFVDYLWVLLAAAGIVLIAPWTNNGINVLSLICFVGGRFWAFISSWEESFKIMKDGGCCNWNALCFPINCAFGIMGNGFSNLTPTFLSLGETSSCPVPYLYIRNESTRPTSSSYI
jgi:inner membrane transporter RhtA